MVTLEDGRFSIPFPPSHYLVECQSTCIGQRHPTAKQEMCLVRALFGRWQGWIPVSEARVFVSLVAYGSLDRNGYFYSLEICSIPHQTFPKLPQHQVIEVTEAKPFIMNIHQDVRNGTLTEARLNEYIEADRTVLEQQDPDEGLTPLGAATVAGYADEVLLLLKSGAKADTLSKDDESPLLLAASKTDKNRARIIQLLLGKTSSNATDATCPKADNNTPLMYVVQKKHIESIRLLRKARASLDLTNLDLTNDDGYNAKDLAEKTYNRAVTRALNPEKEKGDFEMLIDMVVGLLLFIVAWVNKTADEVVRRMYGLNIDLNDAWDRVSANFHHQHRWKCCPLTGNHRK